MPATFAALLSLCLAPAAAEVVDHPAYKSWAKQPIGTSIVVRSRTESKARTLTTTTTTTLKALTPDKATLEVRKTSDATDSLVESPPETTTIHRPFPLFGKTKKEDIGKPAGAIAQGEETLTVAGREYPTVWFDTKGKGEGNLEWKTRTWMSDDVPGRLVKSVTAIDKAGTTMTVELIELATPEPGK